jgi:hypothetical protein
MSHESWRISLTFLVYRIRDISKRQWPLRVVGLLAVSAVRTFWDF